ERAWARGARVVVLPAVPFGVNTTQLDIKLCINMNPSTQAAVLGDVVRSLDEAGPGRARAWRLRGIREGWAWAPRQWTRVSADTGIGDPSKATAEKGAAYVGAAVERIADYLVELA